MATALKLPEGFVLDEEETPKAQLPEGFVLDTEEPSIDQPALEETIAPEAIPPTEQPITEEITPEPIQPIEQPEIVEPIAQPTKPSITEKIRELPQFQIDEAVASIGSSFAAFPVAGIAGLVKIASEGGLPELGLQKALEVGTEQIESFMERFTYQPRTEEGRKLAQKIAYPIELFDKVASYAGDKAQELTGSPLVNAFTKTAVFMATFKYAGKGGKATYTRLKNSTTWRMATIKERGLLARDLAQRIEDMKANGLSEGQIARLDPEAFQRMFEIRKQSEITPTVIRTKAKGSIKDMMETRIEEGINQGFTEEVAIERAVQEVSQTSAGKTQIQAIREEAQKTVAKLRSDDISKSLKEEEEVAKAIEKEEETFRKEVEKSAKESAKIIEKDIVKTEQEIKTLEAKEKLKEKLIAEEKVVEKAEPEAKPEVVKPEPKPEVTEPKAEPPEGLGFLVREKDTGFTIRPIKEEGIYWIYKDAMGKERQLPKATRETHAIIRDDFSISTEALARRNEAIIEEAGTKPKAEGVVEPFKLITEEGRVAGEGKGAIQKGIFEKEAFVEKITEKEIKEKIPITEKKFDPEKDTLTTWVMKKGGINFQKEHLKGELRKIAEQGKGRFLVSKTGKGKTLDQLVEAAKEDGFLRPEESINEFLEMLETDLTAKTIGRKVYSVQKADFFPDIEGKPISFMGTGEIQEVVSDMIGAVRRFKNKGTGAEWEAWHKIHDTKVDDIGNSIYEQYKPKFNEFVQRMKEVLGDLWKQFKNRVLDIYRKAKAFNERLGERGGITRKTEAEKLQKKLDKILTAKDIVNRRRQMVRSVRDHFGLTDKDIQSITRRDIRLMSNYEYKRFLDDLRVKAAELEKHEQAKSQLLSQIQEKNLQKWQNLRKAYKLPPIDKMKTGEIERLDELMEDFEPHDEFLSIRRLERVDATELKGIKTIREAKERLAKEANVPISELEKIRASEFDRFRYDTDLARQNPFYNLLIDEKIKGDIQAARNLFEFEKSLNYYASKARRSRGHKLLDVLIPQDKRVMAYVESAPETRDTLAKDMTPQELDYASFLLNKGNEALHYLIEEGVLRKSTYADKYVTHIRQGLLESLKDEGLKGAVRNVFDRYKHDEQVFNILDTATGEVLPLEKFFKFSMFRTGKIKPSQNLAKSFLEYWRSFENKKNLDRLIPKMSIYVRALEPIGKTERGLLKDTQMERFFKEWMNTKKGRHVTLLAKQGGKFDLSLRGLNNLVTIMDLGLNIPVGITANIGETGFNYIMLGKKNFTKGLIRKRTAQGREILEKYKFWTGKGVWEELQEASKDIGDKANDVLFGLFKHGMTEANKTYLLGSLTGTEFNTGIISDIRLAQMKKDMGEYRYIEGAGSIIGATPEAKSFLKYKTWAVPPLKSTAHNLKNIAKAVAGKGKINPREAWQLYRSLEIITAVLLVGMLIDVDKKDPTFIGRLKSKAMREAMSIMGALNHKLWASAPRIVSFTTSLADAILDIVTLTEYEKTTKYGEKGELKGVRKIKRIATPRAISQFGTGFTEGFQLIDEYSKAVKQQDKEKIAELREQIRDFNLKRKEQGKEPISIINKALEKVRRERKKEQEAK